jgi:predicted O-methyltransferase YrrM
VVLSALWLGERLATQLPVTVLIEAEKRRSARRAVRRAGREGQRLMVVAAGEEIPINGEGAGCVLIENMSEIVDDAEAVSFLARLIPVLRPDGLVLALDATKNPAIEARLAGLFLASALTHIAQQRPRDGAVLTLGGRPPGAVVMGRVS